MMARIIQCAQCKTYEIKEKGIYFRREVGGKPPEPVGEWPLYYSGASPNWPDKAEYYFCGVYCSNDHHREKKRNAM